MTKCMLSGPVGSVIVQQDGKIVIAGGGNIFFATPEAGIIGSLNGTVARFHPNGSLDYGFGCRAEPPNYVSAFDSHLSVRPDGRLLMTGIFKKVDGEPRNGLAMLLSTGLLDKEFVPWRDANNSLQPRPFRLTQFYSAAFDSTGQVVAPFLRMDDTGRVLETVEPTSTKTNFGEQFIGLLSDRGLWLFRPVDWQNKEPTEWSLKPPKARFIHEFFLAGNSLSAGDAAGVLKVLFEKFPIELCRYAVRTPDGGAILLVREEADGRFMRFDNEWRPVLGYTNSLRARGHVSLCLQKDGKLLVARGSDLRHLDGGNVIGAVRLNHDGSIDRSFRCETDERIAGLAVQDDGKILISGFFRQVNGNAAPWLARLNPDGSLDMSFQHCFTDYKELMSGRRVPVKMLASSTGVTTGVVAKPTIDFETETNSLLITTMAMENGITLMEFQGVPNHIYILQAKNDWNTGDWMNIATTVTDGRGSGTLRDPEAKDHSIRFYRIAAPVK